MKRTSVAHLNCSVAQTLEVVGEWWTLLVVRNLMFGQRRFEAIQGDLGIARNILSDRLGTLVEHGIVDRVKYQDHPERFEYRLTDKGRDLFPVIAALMTWGRQVGGPDRSADRARARVWSGGHRDGGVRPLWRPAHVAQRASDGRSGLAPRLTRRSIDGRNPLHHATE
jgi:DNA-binding HxlR family transcriptional regulator